MGQDAMAELRSAVDAAYDISNRKDRAHGDVFQAVVQVRERLKEVERSTVPRHEDDELHCVYVCDRCGQPLAGPHSWCNSGVHVGPNSGHVGRAVATTQLVLGLRNALAPASALQQHGPPG